MVSSVSYAALAAAAVLAGTAHAHQTVYIPAPTFTTTDKTTKTNPIAFLENQGYKPTEDINGFLKEKGAKTLREFLDNKANYKNDAAGATFECGYTDPNGARQPIPANGMMRSSGFTHEGPCEVWIDNTRVLGSTSGNCNKDVPGAPVSYKIDFSVCKGDCLIRWYWFAKRLIGKKWSWQVYKECIPIRGGAAQRSIDDSEDPDSHSYRMYSNETESEDATDAYRGYEGVDGEEILPTQGLADEGVDGEEILPTKGLDEDVRGYEGVDGEEILPTKGLEDDEASTESVRGYEGVDGEEILPTKGLEDDADTQSVGMIENDKEDTESTRYYGNEEEPTESERYYEDEGLKSIPIDEYEAKETTPAYD